MSCMPGYSEVINPHTVGFLTIPRASIKWVELWELLAYILNMLSYSNNYINRLGLAGLLLESLVLVFWGFNLRGLRPLPYCASPASYCMAG